GAPLVQSRDAAAFALIADAVGLRSLADFAQGTQEYPDRSTTLILQVGGLSSDAGAAPHPLPDLLPVGTGRRMTAATLTPPSPRPPRGEGEGEGQRRPEPSTLLLEGPGIRTTATLAVSSLPESFLADWQDNRARFPRGVDIVLAAPGVVACLPRTVKIR